MSSEASLTPSPNGSHGSGDDGECELPALEPDFKDIVQSAKATLADAHAYLDEVQREGLA